MRRDAPEFAFYKDNDNMLKFVNDTMEEVLYHNYVHVKRQTSDKFFAPTSAQYGSMRIVYKTIR